MIALGLVAGCRVAGREPDPEELLALGAPLEGHDDNLAACLAGGVCLTWERRIARIADASPRRCRSPSCPETEVETAAARAALPDTVPHADAAFTAGRAALLGAALAAGDADLFAAALADRLHEPYRAAGAPLLGELRDAPPAGALGTTISGSGPTVIVWAREDAADDLRGRAHRPLPGRAGPAARGRRRAAPSTPPESRLQTGFARSSGTLSLRDCCIRVKHLTRNENPS